jgi:hypothetical protein
MQTLINNKIPAPLVECLEQIDFESMDDKTINKIIFYFNIYKNFIPKRKENKNVIPEQSSEIAKSIQG